MVVHRLRTTAVRTVARGVARLADEAHRKLLAESERQISLQKRITSQNLYRQGLASFLSGDVERARTIWKQSLELDPDNEETRRALKRVGE